MKGYKATKNMKCLDLTYEVGKTYSIDKLTICSHGFHFCQEMKDVVNYYQPTEYFVLLEVEALGKMQTQDNKSATDNLKVIRVVPKEEYTFDVCQYEYDSFGNKIKVTTPSGDVVQYEYDSFGNMIKRTNPSEGVYQWEYDSFGNKIKQTYPCGTVHQYEYDSFGNKIKESYPSGIVYLYEYDSFGNKIKQTNPNGDTWNITIEE
jgi:YD repeat-containing protein